jgi:6-phosphofructokinase 1
LIPEIPYTIDHICYKIKERQEQGKNYCLIIVSEAVRTEDGDSVTNTNRLGQCRYGGIGQYLADQICDRIGAETRVTVLGHIQRGGTASPLDRLVAAAFGVAAVNLIAEGKYDYMVTWQNRQVVNVPIAEAIAQYRAVDANGTLVNTARGMGIYLGD